MKIIIPGGSGQVGTMLARAFHKNGHDVLILSRNPGPAPWRFAQWDGASLGDWVSEFDRADVIINLAGRNVNCRYTPQNKKAILESRIHSTRVVGEAIQQVERPPHTWLQASTATIYAHRYDAPNDEATGIIGGSELDAPDKWRFSVEVAQAWERTLDEAVVPRTRKVKMRSAMIMSPDRGGIFDTLLTLVRFGLGGRVGDGHQYVSWIHDADFVSSINWLIEHREIDDIVNLASPNPLPYAEFMRLLRQAWGIKIGLPATRWMVEIGTYLMGTESELALKSRRVIPGRLLAEGFSFAYGDWSKAARDLVARWRKNNN
jgi:uncharacterized protein (TIGR01777 family)